MSLLGVIDRACLADHRHFDLAGILHRLFDLLGDIARQALRFQVVDLLRAHKDAHFAAGLKRIALVHALVGVGDIFQGAHALDILLQAFTACARARPRDGIRSFHDGGLYGFLLHLVVVRGDGIDHLGVDAVALGKLSADLGVCALHVVVDGLAQVVQQGARFETSTSAPSSAAIIAARRAVSTA